MVNGLGLGIAPKGGAQKGVLQTLARMRTKYIGGVLMFLRLKKVAYFSPFKGMATLPLYVNLFPLSSLLTRFYNPIKKKLGGFSA